jgi:hypothetical protein
MDWGILGLGLMGAAAVAFLVWAIVRPKSKAREESSSQTPTKPVEKEVRDMTKWTLLLVWNIALTLAIVFSFVSGSWTIGREIEAFRKTVDSRLQDISGSVSRSEPNLYGIESELSSIDDELFQIRLRLGR